jgi:hypothetical protein
MKKIVFFILIIVFKYNATISQSCVIKFVIYDAKSDSPLNGAIIEEQKKEIGITDTIGVSYSSNRSKNVIYHFNVSRNGYEEIENYIVQVNSDTTTTTPIIRLRKLNDIYLTVFKELKKDKPDINLIMESYTTLAKSYDKNNDEKDKKEFIIKFDKEIHTTLDPNLMAALQYQIKDIRD